MGEVISIGADDLRHHFQGSDLFQVLEAYMGGLKSVWILGIACAVAAFLASFGSSYRSIMPSGSVLKEPEQSAGSAPGEVEKDRT
jgi:ATP-dependent protease ClpP protease subunit